MIEAIAEVTDEAAVPHPDLITESGRAIVAYYSVLVVNILDINRFKETATSRWTKIRRRCCKISMP